MDYPVPSGSLQRMQASMSESDRLTCFISPTCGSGTYMQEGSIGALNGSHPGPVRMSGQPNIRAQCHMAGWS